MHALLTKGKAERTHDLADLWECVPDDAKARIDRHFQALVASSPKRDRSDSGFDPHDIQSVLAHQARAFELFRYGYEPGGKELNITTAPLDVGIRRVILEMKPERTRHTADVPK